MKKNTIKLSAIMIVAFFLLGNCFIINAQTPYFGSYFTHTATAANSSSNYSIIDNAIINNNPTANFLITPMFDPNFVYSNFNDGIYYQYSINKWWVFGDDNSVTILPNSTYHIIVPTMNGTSFVHDVNTANNSNNWTALDNAATNNNPNALLFIELNTYLYNHPTTAGVWYNPSISKWTIFDEDATTPLYYNADYFVFVTQPSANAFTHTAAYANTTTNITYIDNPATNNNPNAHLIVTPVYTGVYNNCPVGVTYYAPYWSIFNEDNSVYMPLGASFNVMVAPDVSSSIIENKTQHQFGFSPNPVIDQITIIDPHNSILNVKITDVCGKEIISKTNSSKQIDVSSLNTGIYFLIINGESFKFIKE